jgi:chemotaxis protein CheC
MRTILSSRVDIHLKSDEVDALAKAFDSALTLLGPHGDTAVARTLVSDIIIRLAVAGERDLNRLTSRVLETFHAEMSAGFGSQGPAEIRATTRATSVLPLTELERDALGELSNMAMGRAANSLRQMAGQQVLLSVPIVTVLTREAATEAVTSSGDARLVGVQQDFDGAFSGRALLIFPEASGLELVRTVAGREMPLADIAEFEDEALAETGNILLNSWVATVANLLKRTLTMSLPVVVRGNGRQILLGNQTGETLVLLAKVTFEVSQREIQGYIALVMDVPSVDELRKLIANFISTLGATC